jgi:hypothetical protein
MFFINLYTSIDRFLIRTRVKYPEILKGNKQRIYQDKKVQAHAKIVDVGERHLRMYLHTKCMVGCIILLELIW